MENDAIFSGESANVEYKVTVPANSERYMKTVVAYANGRGGKIIFGVDDRSLEVIGMDTDSIFGTIDAITNAISDSCEPTIIPDVTYRWYLCAVIRHNKTGIWLYAERTDFGRSEPLL